MSSSSLTQPDVKYDRQIRLWGVHGQQKLAHSHICLINASATGTEALKNLVLPGIGKFTIIDPRAITAADLATNFFFTPDSLNKPRASTAMTNLTELNPDVQGFALVQDGVALAKSEPTFFAKFSLVLATQLDEDSLVEVERACLMCDVPLIVARTNGLLGHIRLSAKEHCVVESKPSPEPQQDLRVFNPFAQLSELCEACKLEELDDQSFGHTPYVVVLIKALEQWRSGHAGKAPSSTADKQAFVAALKSMSRAGYGSEENLVEAVDKAYLAYGPRPIPDDVADLLREELPLQPNSVSFWVMLKALQAFVRKHGVLPLPGSLPDMTATTQAYIALQRAFRAKAALDLAEMSAEMDRLLKDLGRDAKTLPLDERALFCANAYHLHVARFNSLQNELRRPNKEVVQEAVMEGVGDASDMSPILWYISWRAWDRLRGQATDPAELLKVAHKLCIDDYGIDPGLIGVALATELCRFANAEPHNIAALVGGIASQEAVKLITTQYIPLNNTYLFNGIAGAGASFKL